MSGARDHLSPAAERQDVPGARRSPAREAGPAIADGADPRLAHGDPGPGLLRLQQTAGNAAVAALVAPAVQRAITIDEVAANVSGEPAGETAPATPSPTGEGAGGEAGAPVSSDGSTTTISGGVINLQAPITQSDGILRASTVIADTIVATTYTPGAGNLM